MSQFTVLWNNHPGRALVCDEQDFPNQCAMRMGIALRTAGVTLTGLKTCLGYNRRKYKDHAPGHIRSAQELANHFYRKPTGHGLKASSFRIMTGSIKANFAKFKNKNGMVFIMNGWGSTDHIDIWKGGSVTGELKGGTSAYLNVGEQVWFWEYVSATS
ncbi:T6SS effector amidase Tae4 family protein [Pseudaestuariivita rosea]|uniref:T6SS effector amidase Tae4 family protein n=1 Tax=Pseudaestuariivita rosea TaxID=2763263 RepID=UPI001ABB1AE3|nr:T6SS effector amidase Tae4 family protein [Pseudaestuariivita rosea]